jgi:hypothetical protein
MAELNFDPAKFIFSLPLWICADKEKPGSALGGNLEGVGRFAGIFTDQDQAERFVAAQGLPSRIDIRVLANATDFATALKVLQGAGFAAVLFDPGKTTGSSGQWFKIDALALLINNSAVFL